MPIHLEDLDVVSEAAALSSALIVPCNMCPAVTVAVNQNRPFMQLFRSLLKSIPFEQHIGALRDRLREQGVKTDVFKSNLYHQWFVCMWTSGRRKKLQKAAEEYEAVISLGCDTANETVRDAVKSNGCKVIEGMKVAGLMNAKLRVHLPCDISFEDCKIIPISQEANTEAM
jgi:hypothetical protein